jgi:RNA polymerase sigma factor (sigma-70 family)
MRRTTGGDGLDETLTAPASQAEFAFLEAAVREALEKLPAPHRQVVELRLEGYEVAEIARTVERSKRTVERILQEARGELRTLLDPGE